MALAISQNQGVEMQRPGLGDLAGRGAACGLTPDLRKRADRLLGDQDYPQSYAQGKSLIVGLNLAPASPVTSQAALAGGRVANRGASQDLSYLGAPQASAQRDCPGAREGAVCDSSTSSEADSVMRLRRADHGEPWCLSPGQGSPWPSLTNEQVRTGSGYHDNG